jgi:adenylate kinase
MAAYVILLGPPGVGKGTQADRLARELGLPHISSGELFREEITAQTPLGREAQRYIDRGQLVPDEVTIAMVAGRLQQPDCKRGAILDGFPRTLEQAEALDTIVTGLGADLTVVPFISAPKETLLQRLGGRWTCRNCQKVYHVLFSPPSQPGRCDACGGELYQREDDTPEIQAKRIDVYREQTTPLIDYYRRRGLLVEVDGEVDIDAVYAQLVAAVRGAGRADRAVAEKRKPGVGCSQRRRNK